MHASLCFYWIVIKSRVYVLYLVFSLNLVLWVSSRAAEHIMCVNVPITKIANFSEVFHSVE